MTDTPLNTPPPKSAKPPRLRTGPLKDIATAACIRKKNVSYSESFAYYLQALEEAQQSIYQKKRPRQETLNQQMDILDAMFTYLAVHADWKQETPLSYSTALRAQKQFCATLRDAHQLKFPKPSKSSATTSSSGQT